MIGYIYGKLPPHDVINLRQSMTTNELYLSAQNECYNASTTIVSTPRRGID